MRYRPHKGSIAESVALTVEVEGWPGLIRQLRSELWPYRRDDFTDDKVHVSPYCGDHSRIGWRDVHIVTIDGYGVMGFCEGPAS